MGRKLTSLTVFSVALFKAKADKLTYRQELISIKEENKTMQLKLKAEEEQSKSLQALLASSKKLVQETQNVSSRQREEVQILNTKLEKWKQVAEAATEKSRQANAETDELKRSKNAAQNRAIALSSDLEQERYNVKRQEELAGMLQKKLHVSGSTQPPSSSPTAVLFFGFFAAPSIFAHALQRYWY